MKNLYRISLIFLATTLAFGSETDGSSVDYSDQKSISIVTENGISGMRQDVSSPADINKIKESRLAKAKVEKIKSQNILNDHKNGAQSQIQALNPNFDQIGKDIKAKQMLRDMKGLSIFEKFFQKINKKYTMRNIGDNNSGNKIKFPVETESK